MAENIGKMILLFVAIILGIALFVYVGIPILKFVILFIVKVIWLLASFLAGFVKIAVFLVLLVVLIIGIYAFIKWLMEKK